MILIAEDTIIIPVVSRVEFPISCFKVFCLSSTSIYPPPLYSYNFRNYAFAVHLSSSGGRRNLKHDAVVECYFSWKCDAVVYADNRAASMRLSIPISSPSVTVVCLHSSSQLL